VSPAPNVLFTSTLYGVNLLTLPPLLPNRISLEPEVNTTSPSPFAVYLSNSVSMSSPGKLFLTNSLDITAAAAFLKSSLLIIQKGDKKDLYFL
jgi:hypothetical protein